MSVKPVITYAGDLQLFKSFESHILQGLPQETVEWKRSYGRPPKAVILPAVFEPYAYISETAEPSEKPQTATRLQGCRVLHTYWSDCTDVEVYKNTTKENIQTWFSQLKSNDFHDWLIVLVESSDSRKGNKLLPRTTVLDRIKADFGGKSTERCLSILDIGKTDARTSDSWQTFLFRLRQALIAAFSRAVARFEDAVRTQREHRNDPKWNFCDYFLLQEELAFVFEMLGLNDEALIQYDELDALFTQFVLNSLVGDSPKWLSDFMKPPNEWSGVNLDWSETYNSQIREKLASHQMALIDFRNYLFHRQCALLLLSFKPSEVANRCLPFVQNTTHELNLLNISIVEGGIQCWVLLTCLQVLETCQKHITASTAAQAQEYFSLLWNTAKDKLYELGELCGLLPGAIISSNELHRVVTLFSGISDPGEVPAGFQAPVDKLKDALSSKESFRKLYLELSELALGTFKHCGRLRSARLVGRDMARFYVALNEPQKAVSFLLDILRGVDDEKWSLLKAATHVQLAEVYRRTNDNDRFLRALTQITTYTTLPMETRTNYFRELLKAASGLDESKLFPGAGIFTLQAFQLQSGTLFCGSIIKAQVEIDSYFPSSIDCKSMKISLKLVKGPQEDSDKKTPKDKIAGNGAVSSGEKLQKFRADFGLFDTPLDMKEQKYFKQDNSLSSVAVVCPTPHKIIGRKDSHGAAVNELSITKGDFSIFLSKENIVLEPGKNSIELSIQVEEEGIYALNQISITCAKMVFLDNISLQTPSICFVKTLPSVFIKRPEEDLLAGIPQEVEVVVTAGSAPTEPFSLRLFASRGLAFRQGNSSQGQRELDLNIPALTVSQTITSSLSVFADVIPVKEGSGIEHKITLHCPWQSRHADLPLHFTIPFTVTQKLHTASVRKFVHIQVQGLTKQKRAFEIRDPLLQLADVNFKTPALANTELKPMCGNATTQVVSLEQTSNFLWELTGVPFEAMVPSLKADFRMSYRLAGQSDWQNHHQTIEISDYQTLYTVRSRVDPVKGSEFCRAGSLCHMTLSIESTLPGAANAALMYEVLADQAMWAVCGRTAGVVSIDGPSKHSVTLDVMPLIGGFLPLPAVRLSRYIPADQKSKSLLSPTLPRLEPFSPGQVYNWSKAQQVHVLAVPSVLESSLT